MDFYNHQLTKYDIPLSHLDHKYIKECNDASEIEKIIKILRSKKEGHFPDMEKVAEERLEKLDPKSKLLWKSSQLLTSRDLCEKERSALQSEIQDWEDSMKSLDKDFKTSSEIDFDSMPPVRGASVTVGTEKKSEATPSKSNKRVKPREYAEWDRLDVEAELNRVDEERKVSENESKKKLEIEEDLSCAGVPDQLKAMKAEREKNKGNEAFKAGDYDEALLYYGRSISVLKNAPAYNNRAQIYLNMKNWNQAIDDCDSVLKLDPSNVKAHMRRAVAYKGLDQFVQSQKDLKFVLEKEPNNKQALMALKEVEKVLEEQKISGRRMLIEEVEDSDDNDDAGHPGDDRVVDREDDDDNDDACHPGDDRVVEREDDDKNTNGVKELKNLGIKVKNGFDKKDDRCDSGNEDNGDDDDDEENKDSCESVLDGMNSTKSVPDSMKSVPDSMKSVPDSMKSVPDSDLKKASNNDTIAEPVCKNTDSKRLLIKDNINIDFDQVCYCDNITKHSCDKCDNIKQLLRVIASDSDHYHNLIDSYVTAKEKDSSLEHKGDGDGSVLRSDAVKEEFRSWWPLFITSATHKLKLIIPVVNSAHESIRLGQYAEGLVSIEGCLETLKDPSTSEERMIYEFACLSKAKCNMMHGDLKACIRDCDDVLCINPVSTGALFRKAMAFEQLENYEQAYLHYKSIPSSDTKHPVAEKLSQNCARALSRIHGEDWKTKLTPLSVRPSLSPCPSSNVSSPSEAVSSSLSSTSKSVNELPSLLTSELPAPSSLPVMVESSSREELYERQKSTGNDFFTKGNFHEAIKSFTKCIELNEDQVVPYTNRALCYLRLNQFDEVLEDCNRALIIDFQCTKALYRRALAYKMKSNFEKSIIDLETLLKIDPGNSAAKKELSNVSNIAKQIKEKKAVEALLRDQKKMRQKIHITEVSNAEGATKPCHKCSKESQDKSTQQKTCKKPSQMPTIATFSKLTTTRSVKPPGATVTTGHGAKATTVTSPYEFMQAFNAAKVTDELSTFIEIFDNLKPSQLPRVVTNQLDSYMALIIIRIINHYFTSGQQNKAVEYLTNLLNVDRFDMVFMFFSEAEREEVSDMLEKASKQMDANQLQMIKLKLRM